MQQMKLYSGPLSMFGAKAEMAALEKGLNVEVEFVPFSLDQLYSPKHLEVLRINPKAEVPVLIDGDLELFDSTQIFEHFERVSPHPPLWPEDNAECARARQLEMASDEVFFPNVVAQMPRQRATLSDEQLREAVERLHDYYAQMNQLLADRDYLLSTFTYADIAFYAAQFFARFLGLPPGTELTHLEAWRLRMNGRSSVQSVMGTMARYLTDQGLATSL